MISGRHLPGVAEVVDVLALGEARRRLGLDGDDSKVLPPPAQLVLEEGEREPAEVRAAPDAADEDVRAVARHLELPLGLQPDDRLVRQHVVQHRAERVLRVLPLGRLLDRLRDRHAEAARASADPSRAPRGRPPSRETGSATTLPPHASIMMRRYGFWS